MKNKRNSSVLISLDKVASCVSGYDPDSLNVNDGKKIIKKYLESFRDELSSETVPIRESLGRVLFTDLISTINVPPNDNAAMDGYAFNSSVLNKNILARIPRYSEGGDELLALSVDHEGDRHSRSYFGPINIQKLRIQLLDEYGKVVSLNHRNYSLSLEFDCIYN